MGYTNPSVSDFKAYFSRDFPFGIDPNTSVTDTDVTNAMQMAATRINQELYSSQASYTIGFLYLSAHILVMNLRGSSQGISGQFSWLESSKSVGSVSHSIAIPQRILDNPLYSWYTKTNYGTTYLMDIIPQLSGMVFDVHGRTNP